MPAPKKPADHKAKTGAPFTFTHGDVTHTLPAPSAALANIEGRALRDALLNGQSGEVALGFRVLEASGAPQAAIDAIYEMPAPESVALIGRWMQSADMSGATLPQS